MKKILLAMMVLAVSCWIQLPAMAHEYNPYQKIYQKIAQQELVQGRVQFVYVLRDEDGGALIPATVKYLDYAGQEQTATADEQGLVRLLFLQGKPFVQLREVLVGQQVIPIVGEDVTVSAERQDFKDGMVKYFVLQKAIGRPVVHVFDAD